MLPNYDNSTARPAADMRRPLQLSAQRVGGTEACGIVKALVAAPIDLNVEIADFLPQRVAVEAEQIGGADLVAARRRQRRRQQRHLDFLEDAVIEARRRHAVGKAGKVR